MLKLCSEDGCGLPTHAHGRCNAHYNRSIRRAAGVHGRKEPNAIIEDGEAILLVLTDRYGVERGKCIIDAADLSLAASNGRLSLRDGYAIAGKGRRLSRVLLDCPADRVVDHINGNRLDNRRANLRIVSREENAQNRASEGRSGARNVYACGNGWRVAARHAGADHYGGYYSSFEEAVVAAAALRARLFSNVNEARCLRPLSD